MAWKFLNIGKANTEIERLEKELADAKSGAATQPQKQGEPDKIAALESKIDDLSDTISALGDRIAAIEKTSADASASFKVEIARIDKSLADATPEKIGTRIAAEITARQGQAPLKTGGTESSGGAGDVVQQLQAITDPKKRAQFFKAHEKELKAQMSNGQVAK
jgi:hypothetical protein